MMQSVLERSDWLGVALVAMIIFVGLFVAWVAWSFGAARSEYFEMAVHLPLEDAIDGTMEGAGGET